MDDIDNAPQSRPAQVRMITNAWPLASLYGISCARTLDLRFVRKTSEAKDKRARLEVCPRDKQAIDKLRVVDRRGSELHRSGALSERQDPYDFKSKKKGGNLRR